jgi:hypothetical protein
MNAKELKQKYNLTGTISIIYDGSGDSGYIEEISSDPEREIVSREREDLKNLAYDVLEKKYAGWEINEGSCGTITIDFDDNTIEIEHNEKIERYDTTNSNETF